MVNQKILAHVRGDLVRKMEELRGTLSRTALRMKDGSDRMADVIDQAAAEYDQTVELMIRGRDSEQIRDIHETILRIDQGRFGVCERCGRAISPKRLLLAPMSRLCTVCKQKLEVPPRVGLHPVKTEINHYAY
jgi:DnaK suppressor protein